MMVPVAEAISDQVRVSLKGNYLCENKKLLVAQGAEILDPAKQQNISPERLQTILTLGHDAIVRGIDAYHQKQSMRNPNTTTSPWLCVVQLCLPGEEPDILSKIGLEDSYQEVSRTEHADIDYIQSPYHPYWKAADSTGLLVRVQSHLKGWKMHDGAWLQVHKPE